VKEMRKIAAANKPYFAILLLMKIPSTISKNEIIAVIPIVV
jgi:hypothetical protein